MNQTRVVGMMINHQEIDHILTSISDTLRNAAYKVATERFPKGHSQYDDFFDEDGTLKGYDEDTNKALLKDALDHYVQFANTHGDHLRSDFNYYLGDSFQLVADYINNQPQVMSYLTAQFATACGVLAGALHPVVEDLSNAGNTIEKIESFTLDNEKSYYVVFGENVDSVESYDPKEDDLSSVVIDDTPEALAAWEVKKRDLMLAESYTDYVGQLDKVFNDAIADGTAFNHFKTPNTSDSVKRFLDWSKVAEDVKANPIKNVSVMAVAPTHRPIEPLPRHPHVDSNAYAKLNNWSVPGLEVL